ncbi:MAG: helix-turn-helix transcriptional regulator [Candidatus Pseudobacter hemicellulosilyticus]|uniref:Helix-turn-helix transcriptional regulator n=1 Tax=Candidatus Pseudobacter hemicellulosilyticus TaxID=3121375 RepID=A0AAJ5WKW6_9BACT|nr:MAG: helix-turn-helix transcriptional regulator [Pseudobacter sp.]
MDIVSTLSETLLRQPFSPGRDEPLQLASYQQAAYWFSRIENSVAVLSDLKADKSYIYNGGVAERLGIGRKGSAQEIASIWEEEIFSRIHPEDLIQKHLLELRFFHLLKSLPAGERTDYHIVSKMRMQDNTGEYIPVRHRMFYVGSCPEGHIWLALCLYDIPYERSNAEGSYGMIINFATGNTLSPDKEKYSDLLSEREKEILRFIEKGDASKAIATQLSISINTVNRHRQNILEKLRVRNSLEACRIAKMMDLL